MRPNETIHSGCGLHETPTITYGGWIIVSMNAITVQTERRSRRSPMAQSSTVRVRHMAKERPSGINVGLGVAIGAGIGAALFAATDSPVWIGVGTAIGAALGAAADQTGSSSKDDEDG